MALLLTVLWHVGGIAHRPTGRDALAVVRPSQPEEHDGEQDRDQARRTVLIEFQAFQRDSKARRAVASADSSMASILRARTVSFKGMRAEVVLDAPNGQVTVRREPAKRSGCRPYRSSRRGYRRGPRPTPPSDWKQTTRTTNTPTTARRQTDSRQGVRGKMPRDGTVACGIQSVEELKTASPLSSFSGRGNESGACVAACGFHLGGCDGRGLR
jgi:hypothetical protein